MDGSLKASMHANRASCITPAPPRRMDTLTLGKHISRPFSFGLYADSDFFFPFVYMLIVTMHTHFLEHQKDTSSNSFTIFLKLF